jgi:hypothetical protein
VFKFPDSEHIIMPENLSEYKTEEKNIKARLDDLGRIFYDLKYHLQEKTGLGQITFEDIIKQARGLRDKYEELIEADEINENEKGKYIVELGEMDNILNQAEKINEVEEEI